MENLLDTQVHVSTMVDLDADGLKLFVKLQMVHGYTMHLSVLTLLLTESFGKLESLLVVVLSDGATIPLIFATLIMIHQVVEVIMMLTLQFTDHLVPAIGTIVLEYVTVAVPKPLMGCAVMPQVTTSHVLKRIALQVQP